MHCLRLAIFCLAVFSTSCGQERTTPESVVIAPAAEQAPEAATTPVQQLVALYPSHRLPLQLSTQELEDNPDLHDSLLQGRPIPQALVPILDEEINTEGNDVFALARLELPDQQIGLLTRLPGAYVSSRIILFVLNQRSGKITDQCEVAETFGDAGDSYVRTSSLRWDAGHLLHIQVSQSNCSPVKEDMSDITCVDSTLAYQLRGGRFQILSRKPQA
jgi:hypothetical protein